MKNQAEPHWKSLHSFLGPVLPSGVAEQFAIAEAKLRAWASMDDDEEEDSNDEDSPNNGHTHAFSSQSSGIHRCLHFVSFHLISLIRLLHFVRHH